MDMMQFWSRILSCIIDILEIVGIKVGVMRLKLLVRQFVPLK